MIHPVLCIHTMLSCANLIQHPNAASFGKELWNEFIRKFTKIWGYDPPVPSLDTPIVDLPDIIDLCDDDDETNLLEPYTPHASPLLFPSRIEDDTTAKEGVEISPVSIFAQITPIDESPQQPLTATNVSSGSVVNENFFAEPRTDAVSTSGPLRSRMPIKFTQGCALGCAVGQFLHPPPPQYRFARRPVIVPLLVDNLDRLHESHDSDSRTSLPQCPPISLPRTPVTAGEPLTAVSTLKHAEDLQVTLAAEELPPQNASGTVDQAVTEDANEWSFPTSSIPVSPYSLASTLARVGPTDETLLISEDLAMRDDSIRIADPSPQSFSKALDLAPSLAFAPPPSQSIVSIPILVPSPSLSAVRCCLELPDFCTPTPVTLLDRSDVPLTHPRSSSTIAPVRIWRLTAATLVSSPAPSPP
ncbi:hypothetical protein EDB92DRAFT_1953256 [Lactarius akahatsu]|uniref:Uncharacterized protein n=1 Tax=Lactarius akahatsu TaxID=416441 RepID=A0AAD4L7C0_9AGAM|nr:hypothetical protein EDB92DRAFT_1953256 [Lactarius akahatsu]